MSTVDALLKYFNNNNGVGESAVNALSGLTVGQDSYNSIGSNNDALNAQIQYLSDMYNPDGAVAQQMAKALAAKDAKAGRNSQYAARSATLQSQLASGASNNASRIAQLIQQKQNAESQQQQVRAGQLGSLFDLAKRTGAVDWAGNQLKDLFGMNQSQQPNYSLSGMADSGSPQGLDTSFTQSSNPYSIQTGSAQGLSTSNPNALMPDWNSTSYTPQANDAGSNGWNEDMPYQYY
jgi:hypothetical protein